MIRWVGGRRSASLTRLASGRVCSYGTNGPPGLADQGLLCLNSLLKSSVGLGAIRVKTYPQSGSERSVRDSLITVHLPLAECRELAEALIKFDGRTVRYGMLFGLLDALAGDVGYRHCMPRGADAANGLDFFVVTASVDGMRAFSEVRADCNLELEGYLSWVGRSSMEVQINVMHNGKTALSTQFIMVARKKKTECSHQVPPLSMRTEDLLAGQARANRRKAAAANSLQLLPPRTEEVGVLHKLYLEAQFLSQQKKALWTRGSASIPQDGLSLGRFRSMKDTVIKSVHLMHFQERNIHSKIFGGYLMRLGFETAFVSAICFIGRDAATHFYAVDDIQFVKPANVGAVMEFFASVTFSRPPFIVVEVNVGEIDVESGYRSKTNSMTFVFRSADDLPEVKPRDYTEFIKHLEGRRSLERLSPQE